MIAVIAKIPIKEDKFNEAVEAFKLLVAEVAKEEGTLYYTLNVSKDAPQTIVVMERYRDKEAFKLHSSTSHFNAFFAKAGEWMAGKPEITILQELASI